MPTTFVSDLLVDDYMAFLGEVGCLPTGVEHNLVTSLGFLPAAPARRPVTDPLLEGWSHERSTAHPDPLPHHVWPPPSVDRALRDGLAVSR
jgi:hypothetical protein